MKFSAVVLCAATLVVASSQGQSTTDGKKQFDVRCAGCHGADGAGGEHGPNIIETRSPRSRTPEGLRSVIHNGIPAGGMPAFSSLPEAELNSIAAYVLSLRARGAGFAVPGNAAAGERFFFGAGQCSRCHMVNGRGGILGPDLSNIGRERKGPQMLEAMRNPGAGEHRGRGGNAQHYDVVSVRLRNGSSLRGLAKNESNYDLQLLDLQGKLHMLTKTQITEETHEPKSLMPPLEASEEQTQDLLAYLSRLGNDSAATPPPHESLASWPEPGAKPFAEIVHPRKGEWPTYNGDLRGNRYSALAEIKTSNVAGLAPRWIFSINNAKRLEGTPVVVDGVMYVTTGNEAYALDARSGRQIWHYARTLTKGVIGDAAGNINRGVAILGDRLFMITDNAHMLALNRIGGQLLWDVEMADYRRHYGATSAPLAVGDLVLSGTSGGDEGARGFIDAYKAATGERAWRVWTMPKAGEPLSETWAGNAIEHGCATAWLTGTYDPQSNLIYWPTGNPCPDYNGDERRGDNLYSSSVLAIDPPSGKIRWYFQFTPHDLHDWDAVQTPVLVDANFHGSRRKLLLQANRNGFFYVLDGLTGKFLLGKAFIKNLTWATGIGADGRPQLIAGQDPTPEGTKTCPNVVGATNWMSTSFNPGTGLYYVMALENCGIYTKSPEPWEQGKSFYGGTTLRAPGEKGQKFLRAIDIQTGNIVWEYPQIGPGGTWGGLLSTAGGLVFFCDDSGAFAAVDATNGKPLWHFNTSESWHASPMTYSVDGKQFVAVAAGSNILAFGLP